MCSTETIPNLSAQHIKGGQHDFGKLADDIFWRHAHAGIIGVARHYISSQGPLHSRAQRARGPAVVGTVKQQIDQMRETLAIRC